jgi:hypothetical protein
MNQVIVDHVSIAEYRQVRENPPPRKQEIVDRMLGFDVDESGLKFLVTSAGQE